MLAKHHLYPLLCVALAALRFANLLRRTASDLLPRLLDRFVSLCFRRGLLCCGLSVQKKWSVEEMVKSCVEPRGLPGSPAWRRDSLSCAPIETVVKHVCGKCIECWWWSTCPYCRAAPVPAPLGWLTVCGVALAASVSMGCAVCFPAVWSCRYFSSHSAAFSAVKGTGVIRKWFCGRYCWSGPSVHPIAANQLGIWRRMLRA